MEAKDGLMTAAAMAKELGVSGGKVKKAIRPRFGAKCEEGRVLPLLSGCHGQDQGQADELRAVVGDAGPIWPVSVRSDANGTECIHKGHEVSLFL